MDTNNNTRADNLESMVNKLSAMFRGATRGFSNQSVLKDLQTTFMYFIDDIKRGPAYDSPKLSVFILHWVRRVDAALKEETVNQNTVRDLINTTYTHQNYYI